MQEDDPVLSWCCREKRKRGKYEASEEKEYREVKAGEETIGIESEN